MPWFVKIEKGIVDKAVFDQHVPAHRVYVQQLIEAGHEAMSGYWGDFGGGMLLFRADDLDTARTIVLNDPLIKSGCVDYEIHEWCIVVE